MTQWYEKCSPVLLRDANVTQISSTSLASQSLNSGVLNPSYPCSHGCPNAKAVSGKL